MKLQLPLMRTMSQLPEGDNMLIKLVFGGGWAGGGGELSEVFTANP